MAFRTLAPTPRVRNAEARGSLRVGVHVVSGKTNDPSAVFGLTFVVGVDLLAKFGWKINDRILTQEGTGTDLGTFLLTKSDKTTGTTKLTWNSGPKDSPETAVMKINIVHTQTLRHIRSPISLEPATYQVFGGQVFVCVPWAKEPEA